MQGLIARGSFLQRKVPRPRALQKCAGVAQAPRATLHKDSALVLAGEFTHELIGKPPVSTEVALRAALAGKRGRDRLGSAANFF